MNCRRCSLTYELRRRGYDVEATASSMGWGQSEAGLINALTPGKRNVNSAMSLSGQVSTGRGIRGRLPFDTRKNPADTWSADATNRQSLLDVFKSQPDGARGEAVFNFGAFGHSLSYERFGDKTYIFDTQKGKRYDMDDDDSYGEFINKWGGFGRVSDVQVTRFDNMDLDQTFLSRWSTNRSAGSQSASSQRAASRAAANAPQRPANMSDAVWNMLKEDG